WRRGHGTTSANRWRDGYDTKVAASTPVRRRDEQPGRSPTARSVAKAGGRADRPHRRRTPEDGRAPQARTTGEGEPDGAGRVGAPVLSRCAQQPRPVLSAGPPCPSHTPTR